MNKGSYDRTADKFFELDEVAPRHVDTDGVASISFPYPGRADVIATADAKGLGETPKLFLASGLPIVDIQGLNGAVNEAKGALAAFRGRHQLKRVHLFVKAPSVFAMALGHRLNGVGVVQLYDWVDVQYQATAELR